MTTKSTNQIKSLTRGLITGNLLQRKCDCGNHTVAGGQCDECGKRKNTLRREQDDRSVIRAGFSLSHNAVMQRKLSVGSSNDPLEQEADRIADQVLATPGHEAVNSAPPHIQRYPGQTSDEMDAAPASVDHVISGAGKPMDRALRHDMERHFGHDFSRVRVHSGAIAEQSARDVSARAYTVGHNIVFGAGRLAPSTNEGRRLLAHELTHVVQQGTQLSRKLQRCPDAATDSIYDTKAAAIKTHAEYGKLPVVSTSAKPGTKATADKIIVDAKPKANCLYYMEKLKDLFDTPVNPPAAIATVTKAATATAATAEKKRLQDKSAKAKEGLEESVAKGGTFVSKPGKFGGGNYFVDARDPNNIIVKAKILLQKKGSATDDDIKSIESMQDAIEKHASARGYIISLEFVKAANPDTFKVDIDPGGWPVATNWAGGGPQRFAHELHHMFAFPIDRYNYIEAHAKNPDMEISNRVHWFGEELGKPAGYNNPTSILASASKPNDDDVCSVAALPVATCIAAREKVDKALAAIVKAHKTPEERILNCITKFLKSDPDTMMAVLREIFRGLFRLPDAPKILKRLKNKDDVLGKTFQTIPVAKQNELLKIITP